jgi:hypothetical protein
VVSVLDPDAVNSPLDEDTEEVGVDGVTGDIVELVADSLFENGRKK